MTLNELHNHVANNDIQIFSCNSDKKAMCLSFESAEAIGMNYKKILDNCEEKTLLAEEFSHLRYCLTYHMDDVLNPCQRMNIQQAEARARNHSAQLLVECKDLECAFKSGFHDVWEIAEYLDVEEETVCTAWEYYREKDLISFEVDNG